MTPFPFSIKRNVLFQALALFAILALIIFILLIPRLWATKTLTESVNQLFADNSRIQGLILPSGKPGETLQNIQSRVNKYQKLIPEREEMSTILDKIASRAQSDGIEVVSIDPVQTVAFGEVSEQLFNPNLESIKQVYIFLRGKGKFFEVAKYVSNLEKAPFIILVKHLRLTNNKGQEFEENVEPDLGMELRMAVLMRFPPELEA